jgi:PAS domain S-box-containing protein
MRQMPLEAPVPRAVAAPSTALRYLFGAGVVLVALLVRVALAPLLDQAPFLLFFSAVAVAAWYGGTGPALVATIASVAAWAFLYPSYLSGLATQADRLTILLFVVDCLIVSGLSGRLRAARGQDEAARRRAEREAADREQARSELQQSRDQLAAILEGVTDGITVQDRTGEMIYANQEAVRIIGFETVEQLRSTPVLEVMKRFEVFDEHGQPFPLAKLPGRLALLGQRGGPVLFQYRVTRTGEMRWSEAQATPVFDDEGQVRFAVNIFRDVTSEHQATAARDAFLGVLSHELRTPITTIYAGAEVLARRDRLSMERIRDVSEDIRAEANRLHHLVQDLLVLTRAERDALEITHEPVLVQHVVADVIRDEQSRWDTARIEVTGTPVPVVLGERVYVEQVLRNLIANAGKYSPAEGTVTIDVTQADGDVEVRVLDRGPGFPQDEGGKLFELFYRSPLTAKRAPGAGIGLFVARRLVEAMGGRIWARPREGGGAEFGFSLPVIDSSEEDAV